MRNYKFLLIAFLSLGLFMGCSNDDDNPEPVNQEEVITTMRVTLTPEVGGTPIIFEKQDLDGDGPDAPVTTVSGDLMASTIYTGSILILNETENPAEVISEEIQEEDEDHQFFFTFSEESGSVVTYADADGDGNPIGLAFVLTTAEAGSETLTVVLRHEPNKSAAGVSEGDITNAGGETDVEASFNFEVVN